MMVSRELILWEVREPENSALSEAHNSFAVGGMSASPRNLVRSFEEMFLRMMYESQLGLGESVVGSQSCAFLSIEGNIHEKSSQVSFPVSFSSRSVFSLWTIVT